MLFVRLSLGFHEVALFAVLADVEALALHFGTWAQAESELNQTANDKRADHGEGQREADRFQLLHPRRAMSDALGQAVAARGVRAFGNVRVDRRIREHAGKERA